LTNLPFALVLTPRTQPVRQAGTPILLTGLLDQGDIRAVPLRLFRRSPFPRLIHCFREDFRRASRFPRGTGYSSAGCSPAEPASASPDFL